MTIPRRPLANACTSLVLLASLLASTPPAHAAEDKHVSGVRQASVLTRALAYDRNMKDRAGEAVVVGIVYRASNSTSEGLANELLAAFRQLEKFAVHGLPFRAVRVAYEGVPNLREAVRDQGIDALYICNGMDNDIEAIAALAEDRKVLTFASKEDQIGRGLAVGVFDVDGKPTISLNLGASQREGAAFSSDFTRLSKVVN